MARIPVYDSRSNVQVRRPSAEAPAIRIDADTSVARAASQFGVTISAIAENIVKVKSDQEYAKGKIEGYKALAQTESEAAQDNDFQNFEPKYSQKIKDIREAISKTIRNPQAKAQFQQDYELKSTYSFYDIMKNGRTRLIEYDKDLMAQEILTTENRYQTATTPKEKQNAKDEFASIVLRAVKKGTLTQDAGTIKYQGIMNGLDEGQAKYDILTNPVYAKTELQKGKNGVYKNLTQEKRISLIKDSTTRLEKIKSQEEEVIPIANNKRESELIELKNANNLSEELVESEKELGNIEPLFADAMLNSMRSPKIYKPTVLKSIMKYNELIDRNADLAKKEWAWKRAPFDEITKFRADTLNANAQGFISDKQMTDLLSQTSKRFYANPIFRSTLDQLSAQSSLYATGEGQARAKAEMYGNLIEKVIAGKEPQVAVVEVIQEKLNAELGEAVKVVEEEGRMFAKKGTQRIYSDDGITWYDEKTGEEIK